MHLPRRLASGCLGLVACLAAAAQGVEPQDLVRQLSDADPAVRQEAFQQLLRADASADEHLQAAAAHPADAISLPASRLLLHRRSGLANVHPAAQLRSFEEAAIQLASNDLSRVESVQDALVRLVRQPDAATPVLGEFIARLAASGQPADLQQVASIVRKPLAAAQRQSRDGMTSDPTSGLRAAIATRPDGQRTLDLWLQAIDAPAAAKAQPDSVLALWLRGDQDVLPETLLSLSPDQRYRAQLHRNLLLGRGVPEGEVDNSLRLAGEYLSLLAQPEANVSAAKTALAADAAQRSDLTGLAVSGQLEQALALARESSDADYLSLLWNTRDLVAFDSFAAEDARIEGRRQLAVRTQLRVNDSNHRRTIGSRSHSDFEVQTFDLVRAAVGLRPDLDVRVVLDGLILADPAQLAWRSAAADRTDGADEEEAAAARDVVHAATRASPRQALLAADLRVALAPDEATRLAALDDARHAALQCAVVEFDFPAAPLDVLLNAARLAEESDDHLLALQCRAAALAFLLREDVQAAFHETLVRSQAPGLAVDLLASAYRSRALLALEAGDERAFATMAEQVTRLVPRETELEIRWIRYLDAAGRTAEANAAFNQALRRHQEMLKSFPKSPRIHNQIAWLCSRVKRRLDSAADHASRAVAMSPGNAAYIDTFAEVRHARGEDEGAEALMIAALQASRDAFPLFALRFRYIVEDRESR